MVAQIIHLKLMRDFPTAHQSQNGKVIVGQAYRQFSLRLKSNFRGLQ